MDFGAHLPQIDFGDGRASLALLDAYAETAQRLGYAALAANDHLLFASPWLDGPTALSAVIAKTQDMTLMTTVALPVVRGPVQTAKTLAALDILSAGRLIAGVGPGSSRADYLAVGLDFEERWQRFEDAVVTLRALWRGEDFSGRFYSTVGIRLEPRPLPRPNPDPSTAAGGPPIWIGSWGSKAGLRRTARLGDGWLASAYNTTPEDFQAARERLNPLLAAAGKDPARFPNALATMWTFVTESREEARRVLEDVLAKMLNRDPAELAARLTIGPPEQCALILRAYRDAGVERVLIWPVLDPVNQLEIFKRRVEPLVDA